MRTHGPRALRAHLVALALACLGCVPWGRAVAAQNPTASAAAGTTPSIVTTATAEIEVEPDRASITFAVETRGSTAAGAAAANARIQTAVLDTLRRLGVASAQLRTAGISISPEYEYPRDGGRPTVVGYQARNSIQVEVRNLSLVGSLVDAALGRGATSVGSLSFFASNTRAAEREALSRAMVRAREDADALAEAAGGRITGILQVIVQPSGQGEIPRREFASARSAALSADTATPVESGTLTVRVTIEARFAFAQR